MSRTQLSISLIGIVLALLLGACAPAATPEPTAVPTSAAQPAPAAVPPTATASPSPAAAPSAPVTSQPLTLQDDLGREVKIAAQPARIVSLAPSITEILFAVGAGPQVVGLTKYCTYPPEAATGRAIVGGFSAKSLSVEKIVSLTPDLVFAAGASQQPVSEALTAAGVVVFNFDPQDLAGVYANILTAGTLTGNGPQAEQVMAGMKARIGKVTATAASIPEAQRVKVFYEVWDEPLMTAGPATFIGQVIALAGGINVFADVNEQFPTISSEAVIARSPDVILGPSSHGAGLTAEKIAARPGWQALVAAQPGRIVIVDGDIISRAGPRLADALEAVAHGIYPERFK